MEEATRQRLTSTDIWTRALYMVLFAIAYAVTRFILGFLVVFQFLVVLITGQANEPLLKFGTNLSTYVYQLLQFQTFNSEEHPFPFAPWPDDEPGDNRWTPSAAIDEYDRDFDDAAELKSEIDDLESNPSSNDEPDAKPRND